MYCNFRVQNGNKSLTISWAFLKEGHRRVSRGDLSWYKLFKAVIHNNIFTINQGSICHFKTAKAADFQTQNVFTDFYHDFGIKN